MLLAPRIERGTFCGFTVQIECEADVMTIKLCQLLLMVRDLIQSLLNYALSKVFPAILRLSNREIDVWKIDVGGRCCLRFICSVWMYFSGE